MSQPLTIIQIDVRLFLDSYENFQKVYVPHLNLMRKESGHSPLNEVEQINIFLDLRKKHGITSRDTD